MQKTLQIMYHAFPSESESRALMARNCNRLDAVRSLRFVSKAISALASRHYFKTIRVDPLSTMSRRVVPAIGVPKLLELTTSKHAIHVKQLAIFCPEGNDEVSNAFRNALAALPSQLSFCTQLQALNWASGSPINPSATFTQCQQILIKTLTSRCAADLRELRVTLECSRDHTAGEIAEDGSHSKLPLLLCENLRSIRKLTVIASAAQGSVLPTSQTALFEIVRATARLESLSVVHFGFTLHTSFCQFTDLRALRHLDVTGDHHIDADDLSTFLSRNQHTLKVLALLGLRLCSGKWSTLFSQLSVRCGLINLEVSGLSYSSSHAAVPAHQVPMQELDADELESRHFEDYCALATLQRGINTILLAMDEPAMENGGLGVVLERCYEFPNLADYIEAPDSVRSERGWDIATVRAKLFEYDLAHEEWIPDDDDDDDEDDEEEEDEDTAG